MEQFNEPLKKLFKRVASYAAALAVAVPLLIASAPMQTDAAVMPQGATGVILNQLDADGFKPVGAGFLASRGGARTLVTFWKDGNNDWIATKGNRNTTRVIARGANLEVKKWSYTLKASDEKVRAAAGPSCYPFDDVKNGILKKQFSKADIIQGSLGKASGITMQTYVENGRWLSIVIKPDAVHTTCALAGGSGFQLSDDVKMSLSN